LVKLKRYAGDTGLEGVCADGVTKRRDIVAMVSATEAKSKHPLAKAIASYGKELLSSGPQVQVEEFESFTGQGVKARILCAGRQQTLLIGNARFITQSGVGWLVSTSTPKRTVLSHRRCLTMRRKKRRSGGALRKVYHHAV
jgi:P-type Cu+ transporter